MMLMFPHTSADYDHDDCVEVEDTVTHSQRTKVRCTP